MDEKPILIEKRGKVGTIIINRPQQHNALSIELLRQLAETLNRLADEDELRCLVLRGQGDKIFSAGYDLTSVNTAFQERNAQNPFLSAKTLLPEAFRAVEKFPYPVLAMVNGHAIGGGCELAIVCDIRLGAEDIVMSMPPSKLGIVYPIEGLEHFINVLGPNKTKEIFFTARNYNAREAKEIGLLDHIAPRIELENIVYSMADEIVANAPLSLKGIKRIITILSERGTIGTEKQKEAEALVVQVIESEDIKEGQLAFFEKRKPLWKGR